MSKDINYIEEKREKYCPKCEVIKNTTLFYKSKYKSGGFSTYCKDCTGARVKKNYKKVRKMRTVQMRGYAKDYFQKNKDLWKIKSKKWQTKYPEKHKAQQKLRYAVLKGKIKRKPCIVCGEPKSHGHHPDYLKPLDVVWLCALHHRQVHLLNS